MDFDFIVIGSGLAGLTSALVLQEQGKVLLISKSSLSDSATNLAQGGINAVVTPDDTFESHIKDTLIAGAFHNNKDAVAYMVNNAPSAIEWLMSLGVRFDHKDGQLAPTREAAHSHNRVLHATDFTGKEIEQTLLKQIKLSQNITVWEQCFAMDLLVKNNVCYGVKGIRKTRHAELVSASRLHKTLKQVQGDNYLFSVSAKTTIVTTGGLGQLYEWTTNPTVATGDGVAMAYRAGCEVKDLEFIQFHPTALKDGTSPLFLLSEALRGEGAYLIKSKIQNPKSKIIGERFMYKYDKRLELAPRDIVTRAIVAEQKKGNKVYLDIRHLGKEFILKRFPNISRELKKRGFDLTQDLIPVTPAAHYSCGGVQVDLMGRTSVSHLFAFGEVACTGVHGANRLASNSLLEAVVFPLRLKECIYRLNSWGPVTRVSPHLIRNRFAISFRCGEPLARATPANLKLRLQQLMWEKVGIIRKREELKEAKKQLVTWEKELERINYVNEELYEVKNMLLMGKLITTAALKRNKSLGAHYILK